jgi:predicted transposase YbfD/YdcC
MYILDTLIKADKVESLLCVFNEVEDKRKKINSITYPLGMLLLCIVIAMMANHTTSRPIEKYLNSNLEELKVYGIYFVSKEGKYCMPSKSKINELLNVVECNDLIDKSIKWITSSVYETEGIGGVDNKEIIASVDGKCISPDRVNRYNSKQNSTFVATTFDHKNKVMLGCVFYQGKKSSETQAVKQLLLNPLISCFTADCLHTTKDNLTSLNTRGKKYVFAIKFNTKKLLNSLIQVISSQSILESKSQLGFVTDKSIVFNNCDKTKREITVYNLNLNYNDKYLKKYENCGIKYLIVVRRTSIKTGKTSLFYYITNSEYSPWKLARIIRDHWCIENNLHWDKDVIFKESKNSSTNLNSQVNRSTLISLIISAFRINTSNSVNENISLMSNRIHLSLSVLGF